jgi:hypothetical protein
VGLSERKLLGSGLGLPTVKSLGSVPRETEQEYNFSSVVAKRLGFLPIIKKLTPHLKDKKCTKKFYTPDWVAKEERKEK